MQNPKQHIPFCGTRHYYTLWCSPLPVPVTVENEATGWGEQFKFYLIVVPYVDGYMNNYVTYICLMCTFYHNIHMRYVYIYSFSYMFFCGKRFKDYQKKKHPVHQSDNSQSKSQPKSCFKSTSHVELNGRTRGGGGVLRSLAAWCFFGEISDEIFIMSVHQKN